MTDDMLAQSPHTVHFAVPFEVNVAGVTFEGRQETLAALYETQKKSGEPLGGWLKREPDNRYDPNAIQVFAGSDTDYGLVQVHIGYIPKAVAAQLAPRMDTGEAVRVTKVTINRDSITYGARVTIETQAKEAV